MTASHLQSLIADLDRLLSQSSSRLSWSTSDTWAEREQTRQLLQKIRVYLLSLDSQPLTQAESSLELSSTAEQWVEQITSTVIAQLNSQLGLWFDSLGAELEALRQQRQSLVQDLQSLQLQYQQMTANFMQLLMKRSQDVLEQQIYQTQETIAQQLRIESSAWIHPSEIAEQLIQLQQHSDQLLSELDTTFRTIFETLEQDLQGYSQSLSQGLERMHGLGQQGEVKLLAYINRLSEQLEKASLSPSPTDELGVPQAASSVPIDSIRLLTDLIPSTTLLEQQPLTTTSETVCPPRELTTQEDFVRLQGWYLGLRLAVAP